MEKNKKIFLLTLILVLFSTSKIKADDAPLAYVLGGTVMPIDNNDIQLFSETIDITLYKDYFFVEVNYVFINKGKKQDIVMGFPNNSSFDSLYNFRAYDNDVELDIFEEQTEWHYAPPVSCEGENIYEAKSLNRFLCHKVHFKKNETKKIRNTYKQRYNPDYGADDSSPVLLFHYILKTGAFWKDEISSAEVRVHTDNLPFYFDIENACFNDEKTSLKGFYKKFTNFEPTEDLAFQIIPKKGLVPVFASSTLASDDSNTYKMSNLTDGNLATAWVEATGELDGKVVFHNFYSFTKLYGIGIVNGFAKSKQEFNEKGKIYCLEVEGWADTGDHYGFEIFEGGPERVVYQFILDDVMDVQYLRFKYPIIVSDLSLKINTKRRSNDKKKGAISEVIFLTEE